jgi:hypothetical protein
VPSIHQLEQLVELEVIVEIIQDFLQLPQGLVAVEAAEWEELLY